MIVLNHKEYKKYFDFLVRDYTYNYKMIKEEAEDLSSDVMLKAMKTHDDSRGKFITLLYTVKKTMYIDMLRSTANQIQKHTLTIDNSLDGNATNINSTFSWLSILHDNLDNRPDKKMDMKLLYQEILNTFDKLKHIEKIIIIDYHINDLSYQVMQEKHGIPLGTIKATLHRARTKTKKLLKKNVIVRDFI